MLGGMVQMLGAWRMRRPASVQKFSRSHSRPQALLRRPPPGRRQQCLEPSAPTSHRLHLEEAGVGVVEVVVPVRGDDRAPNQQYTPRFQKYAMWIFTTRMVGELQADASIGSNTGGETELMKEDADAPSFGSPGTRLSPWQAPLLARPTATQVVATTAWRRCSHPRNRGV